MLSYGTAFNVFVPCCVIKCVLLLLLKLNHCVAIDCIPTSLVGFGTYQIYNLYEDTIAENIWFDKAPPMKMGDSNSYDNFIVIHPLSPSGFAEWNLQKQYITLTGVIGLAGSTPCGSYDSLRGTSKFNFYLDGVLVHTSQTFYDATTYENINIDVTNTNILRIEIDALNFSWCDHDTIANPILHSCISTTQHPTKSPTSQPTPSPTIQVIQTTAMNITESENTQNSDNLQDLTETNAVIAAVLLFAVALPLSLFLIYRHKVAMQNRKEFQDAFHMLLKQVRSSANLGECERKQTISADAEQAGEESLSIDRKATVIADSSVESLFGEAIEKPPGLCASETNETNTNKNNTRYIRNGAAVINVDKVMQGSVKVTKTRSDNDNQRDEESALDATEGDLNDLHDESKYDKLVSWLLEHKLGSLLKNEAFMDRVSSINDILRLNESQIIYFMEESGFRLLEKKKFLKVFNALNNNVKDLDQQTLNYNYIAAHQSISAHNKSLSSHNSNKALLNDDETAKNQQSPSQINIIISDDCNAEFSYNNINDVKDEEKVEISEERDLPSTTDEEYDESLPKEDSSVVQVNEALDDAPVLLKDDNLIEAALQQGQSEVVQVNDELKQPSAECPEQDKIDVFKSDDDIY